MIIYVRLIETHYALIALFIHSAVTYNQHAMNGHQELLKSASQAHNLFKKLKINVRKDISALFATVINRRYKFVSSHNYLVSNTVFYVYKNVYKNQYSNVNKVIKEK